MSDPSKIIRDGKRRYTRDRRFRIGVRFSLMWCAFPACVCVRYCDCTPRKLPGGIAGDGFPTLKAIQTALRKHYRKRGWIK